MAAGLPGDSDLTPKEVSVKSLEGSGEGLPIDSLIKLVRGGKASRSTSAIRQRTPTPGGLLTTITAAACIEV